MMGKYRQQLAARHYAVLLFLLFSSPIWAQPVAKDSSASMEKIGEGIYAILHDNATDQWPHGNTGVIVGDNEVLVIDACYLPSRARADIKLIQSITKKPVKYLVFTHWHFDHNNGTIAYKEAYPGITIISERESARWIELNAIWWSKMINAPTSNQNKELKTLKDELAKGADSTGKAFTAQEKTQKTKIIEQRKNELQELLNLQVIKPNKVFDKELTITLGKRKIQLHDWGKANSPHDVTIYLPEEQILFSGDILVQDPHPYTGASWPVQWLPVLKQIEKIPVKTLVLGHGPVQHDHGYTKKVRELMETVLVRVEEMILQGKTLAEIQSTINFDDLQTGVWKANEEDWKYIINVLVERAWRSVRGQGG